MQHSLNYCEGSLQIVFTDLRAHNRELMLFSNPFQVEVDGAPEAVQMELIELQCTESDFQGGATSGVLYNALAD